MKVYRTETIVSCSKSHRKGGVLTFMTPKTIFWLFNFSLTESKSRYEIYLPSVNSFRYLNITSFTRHEKDSGIVEL